MTQPLQPPSPRAFSRSFDIPHVVSSPPQGRQVVKVLRFILLLAVQTKEFLVFLSSLLLQNNSSYVKMHLKIINML